MIRINFNMNHYIEVKLTELGWRKIWEKNLDGFPHQLYPADGIGKKGVPFINTWKGEYGKWLKEKYKFDNYTATMQLNELMYYFPITSFINFPDERMFEDMNIVLLLKEKDVPVRTDWSHILQAPFYWQHEANNRRETCYGKSPNQIKA